MLQGWDLKIGEIKFLIFLSNYYVFGEIISNRYQPEIEEIYLNYSTLSQPTNVINTLTKEKFVSLCLKIFELSHYQCEEVNLNRTAFFLQNSLVYEKHPVTFKTKLFMTLEPVIQIMYPCYGRHNVIHTNYKTDSFYDKFFISTGPENDSVIVYIHEAVFERDDYYVYDYLQYIGFIDLADTIINNIHWLEELKLNEPVITDNSYEVESIYVRETNLLATDPLCEMSKEILTTLCISILKLRNFTNDIPNITFNWTASMIYPIKCIDKHLIFKFWLRFKDERITRQMIPCYSRYHLASQNSALFDPTLKLFYVSSGPRLNSFLLYTNFSDDSGDKTYVVSLIENIPIEKVESTVTEYKNVQEESPNIMNYIVTYYLLKQIPTQNTGITEESNTELMVEDDVEEPNKLQSSNAKYLIHIENLQQLKSYFRETNYPEEFTLFQSLHEMNEFIVNGMNQCSNKEINSLLRKSFYGTWNYENLVPSYIEQFKKKLEETELYGRKRKHIATSSTSSAQKLPKMTEDISGTSQSFALTCIEMILVCLIFVISDKLAYITKDKNESCKVRLLAVEFKTEKENNDKSSSEMDII